MANAKPDERTQARPMIESALRTLDTEAGGIVALIAAIRGPLAAPFAEAVDLIDYSRRFGTGLIAVTAEAESTLAKSADVVLLLPQAREACPHNLAPTTSSLMQLALGDALAVALLESRGFTALDFRGLHPGGRLGAKLKFIRDLMHTGASVPLIALGAAMSDAITEMTAKTFGCVGITDAGGKLAGIITDGDLRRHMGDGLLAKNVDDVMTKNP